MSYTLEFSRTSISGDEHYVEIMYNTESDAEKAQSYIENKDTACHSFSINFYSPRQSVSFEEWVKRFERK